MTREEAISILQDDAYFLYEDDSPYNRQAYDMAISALEELNELKQIKITMPNTPCYECRTCKDGEIYNDAWCRCQHPLIKGCRVKMSDGCEANKLIKAQEEYEQMRKESHD